MSGTELTEKARTHVLNGSGPVEWGVGGPRLNFDAVVLRQVEGRLQADFLWNGEAMATLRFPVIDFDRGDEARINGVEGAMRITLSGDSAPLAWGPGVSPNGRDGGSGAGR